MAFQSATMRCPHAADWLRGCLICDPRTWPPARVETAEQVSAQRRIEAEQARRATDTQPGP